MWFVTLHALRPCMKNVLRRQNTWLFSALVVAALSGTAILAFRAFRMPLLSFRGTPRPLSTEEADIRGRLTKHVHVLSVEIGERNLNHFAELQAASAYIERRLREFGYDVTEHPYVVAGRQVRNLEAIVPGVRAGESVVVGAHYDSVIGTPGANDNASGVAAVLEIARLLRDTHPDRTLRFVFFVNEEPPYFQTPDMGSFVYARRLREAGVKVRGMLSIETIGSYYDAPGTQQYPAGIGSLFPDTGNFLGFVGNLESRRLLQDAIEAFRRIAELPSEGMAAPASIPGVGWSDQWAFWEHGYPAIMVTDTAPFRYPHYHTMQDTPDKLDFMRLTHAVIGLRQVAHELCRL